MAAAAVARRVVLVLVLAAASLAAAPRGAAARSLGGREGPGEVDADAAVDLNATNFDAFLKASLEPWAVVEFFAHWFDSRL
jgi:thiol oxidase